ncbi:MAG TPA: serine/threonine-protein kinase [Ktedonobacteraceae bacterium]
MTDQIGQFVGNYRFIQLLGQGGSAEVYLGEHVFLKTLAAIKILHMKLAQDDLESFLNEARMIARLSHPNIVRVLDFGVESGNRIRSFEGTTPQDVMNRFDVGLSIPFLVMDYAPNGNLRKRFPKGVHSPASEIAKYVKQVAAALQYAHEKRLIHRDIKPENMLLGHHNEVLLSDFGIALVSQSSRLQTIEEIAGTAAYMAPEQFQGKPCFASDQYALGIVTYEWLCGDRPFHGTFTEIFSQHMYVLPTPLHEKLPEISPEVEQVVMKALAKDPHQRFENIGVFAIALEQACKSTNMSPYPNLVPGIQVYSEQSQSTLLKGTPTTMASPNLSSPKIYTNPVSPQSTQPSYAPLSNFANSPPNPTHLVTPVPTPNVSLTEPVSYPVVVPFISNSPAPSEYEPQIKSKRGISRRTVLVSLGLGGLGLAVTGGIAIRLIDFQNTNLLLGKTVLTYRGHLQAVYGMAWSPDGTHIASVGADKTVQMWDATTGKNLFTYSKHKGTTNGVAWLPREGTRIASASGDTTVQVWDSTTGDHILTYRGHTANVRGLTWAPDGKHIASGGNDNTVQVWDATNGTTSFTYSRHSNFVWFLKWSPDGKRIASASEDTTVQVLDASNGNLIFTYKGHTKGVQALAWAPDSNRIASASADTTVQVWDANTGQNVYIYHGHNDAIQGVAWSPNGARLASSSHDVQVWDASNGGNVFIYSVQGPSIHGVAWSPDGTRLASASDDQTVNVWQAI